MVKTASFLLLFSACLVQASSLYKMKPLSSGYLECPQQLRKSTSGKTIYCDVSAAVYSRNQKTVYFASDWWKTVKSSKLMSIQWENGTPLPATRRHHSESNAFTGIEKIEAMTRTEDNLIFIASGAFTHSAETGYSDWATINNIVYWQNGKVSQATRPDLLINGSTLPAKNINAEEFSYYLRNGMLNALRTKYSDTNFFKIEGLSILPGNRLAFGVREIGAHYLQTRFKNIILTTDYRIDSGQLTIGTQFSLQYDFPLNASYNLAGSVGLSSIEYDFKRRLLYMTTSYEKGSGDEDIGTYLWVLPNNSSNKLLKPRLVRHNSSAPYHFAHKAEAMTIDDQGRVILIADDDKVLGRKKSEVLFPDRQFSRHPWQAAYIVLKVSPGNVSSPLPH